MPKVVGAIVIGTEIISKVLGNIDNSIQSIANIKESIGRIRSVEMPRCWCNTKNADSNIFDQRMQELDRDIAKAMRDLEEYSRILQKVRAEYAATQQDSMNQGSALKSPGAR